MDNLLKIYWKQMVSSLMVVPGVGRLSWRMQWHRESPIVADRLLAAQKDK